LVLFYKKELLAFLFLPHPPGGSGKSHSHRNVVLGAKGRGGLALALVT
jgi:hypothetical protein